MRIVWSEIGKDIRLGAGINRVRFRARGRVQGVGFRPSVYRMARKAGVNGFVRNTMNGVVIEVEGTGEKINLFGRCLIGELPPLARLDSLDAEVIDAAGDGDFRILESEASGGSDTVFPVDTAVCADCIAEMNDPGDPRYRYPFINCTNCGPRFTIIEGLPYDRHLTTMAEFSMDGLCGGQYGDPMDRRFHAEPISCPACGPVLDLIDPAGTSMGTDPLEGAKSVIRGGGILAVKGLGGYHLACLASDADAVERLRKRKRRPSKPFAVMFRDMETIRRHCEVSCVEEALLKSPQAPIVLLRRGSGVLPDAIAPGNGYIGVFFPYSPIHRLLMEEFEVLVMTSANFTDEPLISTEKELSRILGSIADAALVHDRRIAHKCDDSIFFAPSGINIPVRRARGYVPDPIRLPQLFSMPILGTGAQDKSTFTLTRGEMAFVSPHLGDLNDLRSQNNYCRELQSFQRILEVIPEVVVSDMHPDYFTTRFADGMDCGLFITVQHHHAHAVSLMVEKGLEGPVIAVVFDGAGYGTDGALWGGEFLLASHHGFERLAHLKYVPMPGGEAAVREPWRMAAVHLWNIYGDSIPVSHQLLLPLAELPVENVRNMTKMGLNSPQTSSMGRLFDAAGSLLGCGTRIDYEAQAAIALEALAMQAPGTDIEYEFGFSRGAILTVDPAPVIERMVNDVGRGTARQVVAAAFHNTVARMSVEVAASLAAEHGCRDVVISGGVFQNRFLCERVLAFGAGMPVKFHMHAVVPPNDGGVSLGQVQAGVAKIIKGLV